jgi:hypothetical protein
VTPSEKLETWCALADAFGMRRGETLSDAALRALRKTTRHWVSARIVLRSDALRGEESWAELLRARQHLGEP